VHALWPQALAFGYRVAVRPSRREPFTPYRLITALHEAGFRHDQLMFLPTAHPGSADIIEGGDLALVYGGDDVVDRYRGRSDVLPQGPGRSKILLTKDGGWPGHLDTIVDAISSHGGRTCINASAVFVEGDPAPVAQAIAERLAALPSLPPEDEKAALPVQPAAAARRFEDYLREQAHGARSWLGADGVVDELGDGSAVLRPAVFQVADPAARQVGIEMPFPCVWVAPWSPAAGIGPLKNTLVLSVATRDERLIERLVREPTIRNVYAGDQPAYRPRPGLPHDGYLGEFLMRAKTVYRT
jgi:acyl-CoA reductase-like NAD-dependent aldehyde dehydrogenase